MSEAQDVIEAYIRAFKLANPTRSPPIIKPCSHGWFTMRQSGSIVSIKRRLRDIKAMTERLLARLTPSPPTIGEGD